VDILKIKSLIELLHDSRLTALELSEDGESIRLERNPQAASGNSMAERPAAGQIVAPVFAPVVDDSTSVQKAQPAMQTHLVKAPMQGILHLTPAPGEQPFVKLGERIEVEQVICIIEAMKMFNPLEAEVAGRVVEILAEPGSEVKAGQALFRIE
jgi:acetyl-CoA carboxylase biotin carboxyl carrier protein